MFKQLEAVCFEDHGRLAIQPGSDYSFAADVCSAPITYNEIIAASLNYPIIFAPAGDAGPGLPNALLGFGGRNMFVNAENAWHPGAYIPAHFRRYPFILGSTDQADQMLVMLDRAASSVTEISNEPGEERLFTDDGVEGPMTKRAKEFLTDFQIQTQRTFEMMTLLREEDLLVPVKIETSLEGDAQTLAEGLEKIDQRRFDALDDKLFIKWRELKILPLIYAHFASLQNINKLMISPE